MSSLLPTRHHTIDQLSYPQKCKQLTNLKISSALFKHTLPHVPGRRPLRDCAVLQSREADQGPVFEVTAGMVEKQSQQH